MTRSYGDQLSAWAARLGARVADVRYPRAEAGGQVCAVRLRPREAPRARVLVAHGAGNDAVFPLMELFRAFLRGGYEIFSFDVDGHGCTSTTTFAADAVRTSVAAAADAAEREGAEGDGARLPLHVVGHSLGGALVLDALASGALDHAASAVVLSAPTAVDLGFRTVVSELAGFFRTATLAQREHYGAWGLVPAFGPVKRRAYPFRRVNAAPGSWSYVAAVRALLGEMRLDERVERIRVPTLLVYSRADRLVGHAQGERLAARMMPVGRLLSLDRATHYGVPFDPRAVEAAVGWMDAHTAVPA